MRARLFVFVALVGLAAGGLADQPMSAQQRVPSANTNSDDTSRFSCAAADVKLRACYTFDGDTKDRSSYGNHANAANISYVAGKAGKALRVASNSRVLVAQHPSLDLSAMTIKVWIRPTSFPVRRREDLAGKSAGEVRMGIIDGEATYRMYVQENGIIRCSLTGRPEAFSPVAVPLGEWTRVACTFDGAVMHIYFNGVSVVEVKQAGKIAASIASMAIGSDFPGSDNFIGEMDQLDPSSFLVAVRRIRHVPN
jgi:hypothetical protein